MKTENLKPDPKGKATASFMLGIVSVTPLVVYIPSSLVLFLLGSHGGGLESASGSLAFLVMSLCLLTIIAGPIGLILGVMGLRSTKRNFAMAGIILCIVGLVFLLAVFYFVGILNYFFVTLALLFSGGIKK